LKVWSDLAGRFPDDRFVLEELAELLAEEDQFDQAIAYYEKLAGLPHIDPYKRLMTRVEIGQVQVRQGKLKEAIETFDRCLEETDPDGWVARDLRRRIEEIFLR